MMETKSPLPILHLAEPLIMNPVERRKPNNTRFSNLKALIEAFAADGRFAAASVVMPAGSETAAQNIASLGSCPNVIVAPPGLADTMATILAVQQETERSNNTDLAVVPAELVPDDADDFVNTVHQACANSRSKRKPVLFARRAVTQGNGIVFESGGADRWTNLMTVRNAGFASEAERFAVAVEMSQLFEANGPIILSAKTLFSAVRQSMAAMLSSCSSAMAIAVRRAGVLYPNAGFLTLVQGRSLIELLAADPGNTLLHPGGELMRIPPPETTSQTQGEVREHAQQCMEIGVDNSRFWGIERLLSNDEGTQVIKVTLEKTKKLVREPREDVSVHWMVISGTAFVKTGRDLRTAGIGEYFVVPVAAEHALTNIGTEELVVYETRIPVSKEVEDRRAAGSGSGSVSTS